MYSCFVDFSKAFDSIPRDILFEKLISKGIKGKVFNLIKNIYVHEKCKVKIGGYLSETFDVNQGVRQGCILSPLLFNIFISDLPELLDTPENMPAKIDNNKNISCILWADDLVMLSESEDGIRKMLEKLEAFSSKNGLLINEDKSKCMIFNKTGRHIRCNFPCGKLTLSSVREYKYLGFVITPSGEIVTGLKDLHSRALYAMVQLRKKLGESFRQHIDISFHLFDALIKPILLYCSDYWGVLKLPKNNPIELIHMKFLKQLLGVQTQTSNTGILLETGRVPLMTYAIKNCIKNWNRIANEKNCNSLIYDSYVNIVENDLDWYKNITLHLNQMGLGYILQGNESSPARVVFQRAADIFHQNAFMEIANENSKLRTYNLVKKEIREEPYLKAVINAKDRISLTKFRLSNHKLMIEKGRHLNIDKSLRKCPFCPLIEDELHFLVNCKMFAPLREELMNNVQYTLTGTNFKEMTDQGILIILLENIEIAPLVAKYLRRSMELREFLIENHKQHV